MAEIEHDPEVAPAGEAIHMPEPSYMPFALAISITFTLLGLITWLPLLIIGGIITLVIIVRWIRTARAEMAELPLEHH
jgi:ABC-type Co2+ transport system permease subunit